MKRVSSVDVVNAYKATNLIPIRMAWQSEDQRGGCAIDALAYHYFDMAGHTWAEENLDKDYVRGFTDAWDVDDPMAIRAQTDKNKLYQIGFWDAVLCREAVEKEFDFIATVESV